MNKTVFAAVLAASTALSAMPASADVTITDEFLQGDNSWCRYNSSGTQPPSYSPFARGLDKPFPMSVSGITYAGGDTYYIVADDKRLNSQINEGRRDEFITPKEIGLYKVTMRFISTSDILSCGCGSRVELSGAKDLEAVAYDPASGNVWAADEEEQTIREYDVNTGAIVSTLDIPPVMTKNRDNLGFESLTISGDGLTMWTANEESLKCDGPRSSYYESSTNRLVKFTRKTVYDKWQLAAMYPYVTGKWQRRYDYNNYCRRGISELCALPDGSLLVLERECSSSSPKSKYSCQLYAYVYRITANALSAATDVKDFQSLSSGGWNPVDKGSDIFHTEGADVNLEAMCLGDRLTDNTCAFIFLNDSGDNYTTPEIFSYALAGLNVHTLDVAKPTPVGNPSIVGQNYRFVHNSEVTVDLLGEGIVPTAYTNRGDLVVTSSWRAVAHGISGVGPKAKFNITKDDTLSWHVSNSPSTAQTPIYAHDTFEEYSDGTPASSMKNWSGEGVVALGTPPQSKWILKRDSHNRVLDAEDEVERKLSSMQMTNNKNHRMDMLVQVRRSMGGLNEPTGNVRLSVQVDANGCLSLWHLGCNNGQTSRGWSILGPYTYSNGTWIKLSIVQYCTSSGAFAYVAVNDSVCNVMGGYGTANDTPRLRTGYGSGAWFPLPSTSAPQSLTASGTKIDDFVVAMPDFVDTPAAHNIVVSPLSSVGGDSPRMTFSVATATPAAAAPVAARPRSASSTAADSSAEPADAVSAPAITGFGLTADNRPRIRFTGFAEGAVYRVVRSASLDFEGDGVEHLKGGVADVCAGVAVWEGEEPCDASSGAKFYRIEIVEDGR